jgi:hypothetical protein
MNHRIKELAEQAELEMCSCGCGLPTRQSAWFAELIVKECIDKIETYRIPVGNSAAGEMACEWTYDALKEIRGETNRHFGVEE